MKRVALLILALLLAPPSDVFARDRDRRGDGKRDEEAQRRPPTRADEAAERARREAGGRVLSIRERGGDNGGYRVKILTPEGEVRYLEVRP